MTVNPRRVARLQEHGLTEYEARAYLALLELEKAEASQIADVSRVPRTKIYQALDALEEKKLLRVIPERPKTYIVQPLTNYLDELEKGFRAKADDLATARSDLSEEFSPRGAVVHETTGSFVVLRGRKNIQGEIRDMISRAGRDLSLATSEMGGRRLTFHESLFEDRARAGVAINFLCPLTERNIEQLTPVREFSTVRHALVDIGGATYVFVDDKEVLMVHHVPDDHHYFQGSDVALWSNDPAIVRSLKALFTLSWNLSLAWEEAHEGTATRPPPELLAQVANQIRAQAAANVSV